MVQANALTMLAVNRKTMTRAEWERFKATQGYKKLMLYAQGKRREVEEMELEEMRKAAEEAWGIALEMATSILSDEVQAASALPSPDVLEALKRTLAERLLLEQGYLPPTYIHIVSCTQCGQVVSNRAEPKIVDQCFLCTGIA